MEEGHDAFERRGGEDIGWCGDFAGSRQCARDEVVLFKGSWDLEVGTGEGVAGVLGEGLVGWVGFYEVVRINGGGWLRGGGIWELRLRLWGLDGGVIGFFDLLG